jgi:hypothetical protein
VLAGKRFTLERATLGVQFVDGKRRAITVPEGTIIKIVADPTDGDGMVDVLWEKRLLEMFEVDIKVRGTEITDQSAGV